MMNEIPDLDVLTREQRARIECLQAARNVLVAKGIASSGKADPTELVSIAQYIETGEDPYYRPLPPLMRLQDDPPTKVIVCGGRRVEASEYGVGMVRTDDNFRHWRIRVVDGEHVWDDPNV